MSYHGYKDQTITLHDALHPKSDIVQEFASEWAAILRQITEGCNSLHNKYKIIHNDLKCDNIVLASQTVSGGTRAVIVDFNKACEVGKGKKYNLSNAEKEQYKNYHHHIAPDLRDGHCYQSVEADVFSLGKIIHTVCIRCIKALLEVSSKCMNYNGYNRPTIKQTMLTLTE